jgi:hypothetical protein
MREPELSFCPTPSSRSTVSWLDLIFSSQQESPMRSRFQDLLHQRPVKCLDHSVLTKNWVRKAGGKPKDRYVTRGHILWDVRICSSVSFAESWCLRAQELSNLETGHIRNQSHGSADSRRPESQQHRWENLKVPQYCLVSWEFLCAFIYVIKRISNTKLFSG